MRIAITMGDPAGIGPEVLLRALQEPSVQGLCDFVVLGDAALLRRTAEQLRLECPYPVVAESALQDELKPGVVICDFANAAAAAPGQPSAEGGRASLQYIYRAIDLALAGAADALVTGPINKHALALAGAHLAGHTEILAQRTRTRHPVMMLVGERLRVSLVTIHLALKKVPGALTEDAIVSTIRATEQALREWFGIERPRIAVCGLNPHASDAGRFGSEEAKLIEPAIRKARSGKFELTGPHPPDAVFFQAAAGRYDAVIAMYHDQGLIPLKLLHFDDAVNVTLGLPIIRTSVDHGTAYDIVGKGVASPRSMVAAIKLAHRLAAAKARNRL